MTAPLTAMPALSLELPICTTDAVILPRSESEIPSVPGLLATPSAIGCVVVKGCKVTTPAPASTAAPKLIESAVSVMLPPVVVIAPVVVSAPPLLLIVTLPPLNWLTRLTVSGLAVLVSEMLPEVVLVALKPPTLLLELLSVAPPTVLVISVPVVLMRPFWPR